MQKHVDLIADSIVSAVQNQREKVKVLLLKNGVVIPTGTSDAQMIIATSNTFKKSKPFRKEFIALAVNDQYISGNAVNQYSNFTGPNGFSYDSSFNPSSSLFDSSSSNVDSSFDVSSGISTKPYDFSAALKNTPSGTVMTKKDTPASTGGSSTSFWTTANLMALFNKAGDVYTTAKTSEANVALAKAAEARANAGIQDTGAGASTLDADPNKKKTTDNTVTYVVVGVLSIALIGGMIWYFNKKK